MASSFASSSGITPSNAIPVLRRFWPRIRGGITCRASRSTSFPGHLCSSAWRSGLHGQENGGTIQSARFALVCFLVMFGVMSTAHFKRADYLLPAYPFAAMALSCQAEAWLQTRTSGRSIRLAGWLFGGTLAAVAVGWVVMTSVVEPREEAKEEKRRFAEVIRAQAPAPNTILQFRMESHLLSYHLGRPVYTFVEWSELKELLAEPGPHFVVMPPEYVFAASQIITSRRLVEVARLADYTAARPSRPLVFLRTAD